MPIRFPSVNSSWDNFKEQNWRKSSKIGFNNKGKKRRNKKRENKGRGDKNSDSKDREQSRSKSKDLGRTDLDHLFHLSLYQINLHQKLPSPISTFTHLLWFHIQVFDLSQHPNKTLKPPKGKENTALRILTNHKCQRKNNTIIDQMVLHQSAETKCQKIYST